MLDTKPLLQRPEIQRSSVVGIETRPERLHIGHGALALLIAAPVVLMFWFVLQFGVNVPYMDEWNFAALAVKSAAGQMHLVDLLKAQNNEHMLATPYTLMLLVSSITKYNSIALMVTSAVLVLVADLLWFNLAWQFLGTKYGTTKKLLALIPVSLLVCSVRQYENLLWGFQVQITLLMLLAMITLLLLDKSKKADAYFAASIATAVMCTYSFANGLFIWPVGVFLLFVKGRNSESSTKSSRNVMIASWLVVGAAIVASYFMFREATSWTNSQHGSVQLLLHRPKVFVFYLMTILGNPLTFTRDAAIAAGTLLTVLSVTLLPSAKNLLRRFDRAPVILSIMLFSAFACLVICAGRVGSAYGIEQALVSRYCTMVTPGIISLYLLCVALADSPRPWSRVRLALATVLLLAGVGYTFGDSCAQAREVQSLRLALIDVVHNYRTQGQANLSLLAPDTNQVKQITAGLEQHHLNPFAR
jgi:hypothetical protein